MDSVKIYELYNKNTYNRSIDFSKNLENTSSSYQHLYRFVQEKPLHVLLNESSLSNKEEKKIDWKKRAIEAFPQYKETEKVSKIAKIAIFSAVLILMGIGFVVTGGALLPAVALPAGVIMTTVVSGNVFMAMGIGIPFFAVFPDGCLRDEAFLRDFEEKLHEVEKKIHKNNMTYSEICQTYEKYQDQYLVFGREEMNYFLERDTKRLTFWEFYQKHGSKALDILDDQNKELLLPSFNTLVETWQGTFKEFYEQYEPAFSAFKIDKEQVRSQIEIPKEEIVQKIDLDPDLEYDNPFENT